MSRQHEPSCHTSRGGLWCTCVQRLYARYDPLEVRDMLERNVTAERDRMRKALQEIADQTIQYPYEESRAEEAARSMQDIARAALVPTRELPREGE